jgi:hypothetical protein
MWGRYGQDLNRFANHSSVAGAEHTALHPICATAPGKARDAAVRCHRKRYGGQSGILRLFLGFVDGVRRSRGRVTAQPEIILGFQSKRRDFLEVGAILLASRRVCSGELGSKNREFETCLVWVPGMDMGGGSDRSF